jgi:predicted secreted hydrolase
MKLNQFYKQIVLFTILFGLLLSIVILVAKFAIWNIEQPKPITIENLQSDTTTTFEPVLPGKAVTLPADFKIHSIFQHEAWRYVAMLNDDEGNNYLVQWYFYRLATSENGGKGWESPQIYHSEAIITTADDILKDERFARGGIGLVSMRKRPYQLTIDDWSWRSLSEYPLPGNLSIRADTFGIDLNVRQDGRYILMGEEGYQVTHELLSRAIYGYKAPFINTDGVLTIQGNKIKVQGVAWLNQLWGTDLIGTEQRGFNLFVFRFDDGRVLSLVKSLHDEHEAYVYGTLAFPNGAVRQLSNEDIEIHSMGKMRISNGKKLPLKWLINVPKYKIFLISDAQRTEQWIDLSLPSWSGVVEASGSDEVTGFMRLVGY